MANPAQPQLQPPSISLPHRSSPSFDRERVRGRQILYIDDEPLMRHAANRLLRYAGAHPLLAESHAEALALAAAEPDLAVAILDYHMPDGPIERLIDQLRIVRPLLPMIGTSGAARHDDFQEHGVRHFLAKPWNLRDLVHVVGMACAAPSGPVVRAALPGDP